MTIKTGDMELNALLDGELDRDDAARVLEAVNRDPHLASRMESLMQVSCLVRSAYGSDALPAVGHVTEYRKNRG